MTWQRYLSRHHHARRPLGSLSTGEARAVARAECFIGYGSRVAVKEDWIEISGLPASPVICDSLSPPLRYTERGETTSIRCSPSTSTNTPIGWAVEPRFTRDCNTTRFGRTSNTCSGDATARTSVSVTYATLYLGLGMWDYPAHEDYSATTKGLMSSTSLLMAWVASHKSTARCALSQNSGELPNSRARRSAISGLTARRSRTRSLMVWRETPSAPARPEIVSS